MREELFDWTSGFLATTHLEETAEEQRLRHAACLLSDIGWRAHPDYRAEQSHDLDRQRRPHRRRPSLPRLLALAASYRHVSGEQDIGPVSRSLVSARQLDRARILGAAMRVAYIISAAMPGVLPRAPMIAAEGARCVLTLPPDTRALNSERLQSRLKQFARLIGGDPEVRAGP